MYEKIANQQFITCHTDQGAYYGKPPEYAVVFPIQHIEDSQPAGNPKKEIFQGYQQISMLYQFAQNQKPIVNESNDNAHNDGM
ncbi:MAG: hypothetical protein NC318_14455 [Blautia sp.]|nr:hypothetical protein [Blautia sp.]